jgi:hypothetical protein
MKLTVHICFCHRRQSLRRFPVMTRLTKKTSRASPELPPRNPTKTSLQKPQPIPPLGGSVRAVEDEIESAVGIIATSLTLRTSILRLKDLMATLIGEAIKDEAGMQWPSVQPCWVRDTFYMLLLHPSFVFEPFFDLALSTLCGFALSGPINHLERYSGRRRGVGDHWMQTTMKFHRICQHHTNRYETMTPD